MQRITPNSAASGGQSGQPGQADCPAHGGEPIRFPAPRVAPFDPPPAYLQSEAGCPVKPVRLWNGRPAWLVTSHADIRALLTDPRISADSSAANYPGQNAATTLIRKDYQNFAQMDPPGHTAERKLVAAEFSVRRVETMRPAVQATVDLLLDELLAGPAPADLVEGYALPIPMRTICAVLGVPYQDHELIHGWARAITSNATPADEAARLIRQLCDGYLAELVRRKDADPGDDVLSRLVANHMRSGAISLHKVVSIARVLLMAGHESTGSTIALGVAALLYHPDQLQRLRQEPSLLDSAVEEILRYVDVTHSGRRRTAKEDIAIGGVTIRAGDAVILHNPAGNRDASVFEDPGRFDITRNPRQHLAFGYGVHQCLGQPLARLELRLALGTLLRRMPGLRLAEPFERLEFQHGMAIYGVERLPVLW